MRATAESEAVLADLSAVAELYAARAERVRQLVRRGVHAPEPVIEDACQFAWSRLVHHRRRVRRHGAQTWLVTTATHEAVKLLRIQSRDVSLESVIESEGERPPFVAPTAIDDLVADRGRLAAIAELPERQQRLVWLQGLGLSYAEIAAVTGDSARTVERQLSRAKRALRRIDDGDATAE